MRTGRCLCGAVAYELAAEVRMLALCHCRDCQYITGGEPSSAAVAPPGSFKLSRGALKTYWTVADSGNRIDRNFCPECGTLVVTRLNVESPFVVVSAGTLDEPLTLSPRVELWTSSAQAWAHRPVGVASFEKNPV